MSKIKRSTENTRKKAKCPPYTSKVDILNKKSYLEKKRGVKKVINTKEDKVELKNTWQMRKEVLNFNYKQLN